MTQWESARMNGIGASDAAAVMGLSPWKTNVRLWEEKTGRAAPEDISGKPAVRYGTEAEEPLRRLFELDFPEYDVYHEPFRLVFSTSRPFLFATLDGLLVHRETGGTGVLEIKTTEIHSPAKWREWDGRVPQPYYCQILHQLLVTGRGFAILKAQIKYTKDGELQITTRHYRFERRGLEGDIETLLKAETEFWGYVERDERPPLKLPEI